MRLHHLKREDKLLPQTTINQQYVRTSRLMVSDPAPRRQNVPMSGARPPMLSIAELSLGTMNLQTIVKNASLVEDKPMVAGRRRHIPREEPLL